MAAFLFLFFNKVISIPPPPSDAPDGSYLTTDSGSYYTTPDGSQYYQQP